MEERRTRALALGLLIGLTAGGSAWANPDGPTVVHGQVSMTRPNANTLNITNSPGAIVNWSSFSIGSNETTRFIQQSASSSVLNRVIGENPSQILGQLLSNGRVFLVNPNGVVFGPNSVVVVAGLIASTLQMSDADFLAGKYHFEGDGEGFIDNRGYIRAGPGGEVVLIAPSIENSGIIEAEGGQLLLAAGRSVTLASLDYEGVQFEVQAPEDEVLNLGALLAEQGAAGVFAGTIKNEGRIEANTLTIDETGTIVLSAADEIELEGTGSLDASGPTGGQIRITADRVVSESTITAVGNERDGGDITITGRDWVSVGGAVDASGQSGGRIKVNAGGLSLAAPIRATGRTGSGGEVTLNGAFKSTENTSSVVDTSGASGGTITHIATQQITTSGTYIARGHDGPGGEIALTAPSTKLLSAKVDASGRNGGEPY